MPDREKIELLKQCLSASCRGFRTCPYSDTEWDAIETVLELLREQEKNGWISVKDRLPENGQFVVVRHEVKGRIYSEVAHYIMDLWWLDWDTNGLELNAISWVPLPEPLEEVGRNA